MVSHSFFLPARIGTSLAPAVIPAVQAQEARSHGGMARPGPGQRGATMPVFEFMSANTERKNVLKISPIRPPGKRKTDLAAADCFSWRFLAAWFVLCGICPIHCAGASWMGLMAYGLARTRSHVQRGPYSACIVGLAVGGILVLLKSHDGS